MELSTSHFRASPMPTGLPKRNFTQSGKRSSIFRIGSAQTAFPRIWKYGERATADKEETKMAKDVERFIETGNAFEVMGELKRLGVLTKDDAGKAMSMNHTHWI